MFVKACIGVSPRFSIACDRMGQSSPWTSLTVCENSQAWVCLTNLLILWISTQSCDNDTSWVDLTGQTAGGRGGKPICSRKDWGESLITHTPKETKREGEIYPSISTSMTLFPLPSPRVSCFPVCRYGCMNLLQAQWIGCAALLRAGAAKVPQVHQAPLDKPLACTFACFLLFFLSPTEEHLNLKRLVILKLSLKFWLWAVLNKCMSCFCPAPLQRTISKHSWDFKVSTFMSFIFQKDILQSFLQRSQL